MAADEYRYLPFRQRLANLMSRNLGSKTDSSFGAGRRSSAALLIASLARENDHRLLRVEQHRAVKNDVLMHSHRHFFQCPGDEISVRHRFQQIAADGIEKVKFAVIGRLDHVGHLEPRPGRDGMAPEVGEAAGGFVVNWKSTGELIWFGAALAAPLDPAVTADRHDAAFVASEYAADKSEIDYGLDVFHTELMLGQPHAVDDNGRAGMTVKQGKALYFLARQTRSLLEHVPGLSCDRGLEVFIAAGVFGNEFLIYPLQRNECLMTPLINAMSPPTRTWKKSSMSLVPNRALLATDSTQ